MFKCLFAIVVLLTCSCASLTKTNPEWDALTTVPTENDEDASVDLLVNFLQANGYSVVHFMPYLSMISTSWVVAESDSSISSYSRRSRQTFHEAIVLIENAKRRDDVLPFDVEYAPDENDSGKIMIQTEIFRGRIHFSISENSHGFSSPSDNKKLYADLTSKYMAYRGSHHLR